MVKLPDEVFKAINDEKNSKILATVGADGSPHAIQVGSIRAPSNEMLIAGAILMKKTGQNLQVMKKHDKPASILVLGGQDSYEVRCNIGDFVSSGPLFDTMSAKIKQVGLILQGVWTFSPVEVFNQSASYEAGKKIA